MADSADSTAATTAPPAVVRPPVGSPYFAGFLAWLIPGLGHLYVKRWRRGVAFFLLIVAAIWVGCALQGNLYRPMANQPLSLLATLGAMGMGAPYFLLRGMGYAGDLVSPGYEYGTAFLLTAGLMNLLLVLDAWDISRGNKD